METLLQDINCGLRMLIKKPMVAAVAVIALAAGYFPARRASKVDSMIALRSQ